MEKILKRSYRERRSKVVKKQVIFSWGRSKKKRRRRGELQEKGNWLECLGGEGTVIRGNFRGREVGPKRNPIPGRWMIRPSPAL